MNPSPVQASYVSPRWRANVVKVLLIAGAVVNAVMLVAEVMEILFPSLAEVETEDNVGAILFAFASLGLALFSIVIFLVTVVFFSIWLYRSYENLRSFGHWVRNLQYSSGWAVGSFFVPFVNLVVPYRAVRELWQNSVAVEETRLGLGPVPSWFPLWWFFWLTSNFAGRIYFRMSLDDSVPQQTTAIVGLIADVLSIGAALFAFVIVGTITKRQEETSARLKLNTLAGPPPPDFENIGAPAGFNNQSEPSSY